MCALQRIKAWFSILIFKRTCQFVLYIYIYIILKIWEIGLRYSVVKPADVNAIYFTSLRWIMNVWSSFETSLGNVWLGRPNPKLPQTLNFYLRRRKKKTILLRIVCTTTLQSLIFNFDFHLFLKEYFFFFIKKIQNSEQYM